MPDADFTIKANDRKPSISATLGFEGAGAVDLSDPDTDVQFIMKVQGPNGLPIDGVQPVVKASAVIVGGGSTGAVRYDWAAGDTAIPGDYLAEWEVTGADGRPQTFPLKTWHTIKVLPDLDMEG